MSYFDADVIIVGAGIAGLTAAMELTKAGKKVLLLDQETETNIGGQAFWSFGGLFFINSPQQQLMGISDSYELAYQDWMGTAGFDRQEDHWPKQWAEAYLQFATHEKYDYVKSLGIRFFPVVGWAERGDGKATGHGNSVPRFHIPWGTGTGIIQPFVEKAYEAVADGRMQLKFRHQVTKLITENGAVTGVRGNILADDDASRGKATNREVIDNFIMYAPNTIISSGGIGANHDLVKKNWPTDRLGKPPKKMISGVPAYVDGKGIGVSEDAGASIINRDRMWHYVEGIENFAPIWPKHGIRILPGPSSMWFDAEGNRLPAPYLPGFDTLGTLQYIQETGYDYSWFILTQKIIKKEFALSGSEQNPDLTNKDYLLLLQRAFGKKATGPVEAFKEKGKDFLIADNLEELVHKMNRLAGSALLKSDHLREQITARDRQIDQAYCKDAQITFLQNIHHS